MKDPRVEYQLPVDESVAFVSEYHALSDDAVDETVIDPTHPFFFVMVPHEQQNYQYLAQQS